MAITNKGLDLKGVIVDVLQKAKFQVVTGVDSETGVVTKEDNGTLAPATSNPNPSSPNEDTGHIVHFVGPTKPTYQLAYTTDYESGIEKIAEAIAQEVLNYIIANAEIVMKPRMDGFEDDYNTMLTSMTTQATALTTAASGPQAATPVTLGVMNTALALILNTLVTAGGGTTRTAETATTRAGETTEIK